MTMKLKNIMLLVPMGLFGCNSLLNESSVNQISRSSSAFNEKKEQRFMTPKHKNHLACKQSCSSSLNTTYLVEPVYDPKTGLFWQKKAPHQLYSWDSNVFSDRPKGEIVLTKNYCNALNDKKGEPGWRTPDKEELKGLFLDPGSSNDNGGTCTYLHSIFEGRRDCYYWTANWLVSNGKYYEDTDYKRHIVDFNLGESYPIYIQVNLREKIHQPEHRFSKIGIRCVRDFNASIDPEGLRKE